MLDPTLFGIMIVRFLISLLAIMANRPVVVFLSFFFLASLVLVLLCEVGI